MDLKTFACTDIARSSFVNRTCYDKAKQFMVVKLQSTYYSHCEMPGAIYDAFLATDLVSRYYNANIKGTGNDGPYDSRTHAKSKY